MSDLEWPLVIRLREGRSNGSHLTWRVTDIHLEAADALAARDAEIAALRETMQGIATFGRRHPGHGYSCATLALECLAKLGGDNG